MIADKIHMSGTQNCINHRKPEDIVNAEYNIEDLSRSFKEENNYATAETDMLKVQYQDDDVPLYYNTTKTTKSVADEDNIDMEYFRF